MLFPILTLWYWSRQKQRIVENQLVDELGPVDWNRWTSESWFEIASIPQWFSEGCTCTEAKYTLLPDGSVKVDNRCFIEKSKKWNQALGKATVVPQSQGRRAKVSFFPLISGDYYVYYVDEKYQTALVGTPDKKSLWILSRNPVLDTATVDGLKQKARDLVFPVEKLTMTLQEGCERIP